MPDTSTRSTPAPGGTSQTDSKGRVVSILASSIATTPTPLRGLEHLPTPIHNAEARATITNPLTTRVTEMESETEAVAIATTGCVDTLISGLRQLQRPSIWSLRHDACCICNGQTHGALYVQQMAIYECKRLGDGKLCNERDAL